MRDPADTALDSDTDRVMGSSLWRGVPGSLVRRLLRDSDRLFIPAGSALFDAGDAYREQVYLHIEGTLDHVSADRHRRQAEPGNLIGLANYLDGGVYRSSARAVSDCYIRAIPATTVKRLEQSEPAFFETINKALAARMRKALQARETVRGTLSRPVRQYMRSGLATCDSQTSIADAWRLLEQRGIGSLGVIDDEGRLLGLTTAHTLLMDVVEHDRPIATALHQCALLQGHTVRRDAPLWEAEALQRQRRLRDVVVVDDQDRPVGLISQSDIVQALANPPFTLEGDIRAAADLASLTALRQRVPDEARGVHETHRSAGLAVRVITDVHLALQRRTVELVLEALRQEGLGEPPCPYALIIMGSGGRGEMLLRPDQDNGLIIADEADASALAWFERFAERLNPALDQVGYHLCPGDVMTRNVDYRRTLAGWKDKLSTLTRKPGRREARLANIVLDFATLHGDDDLTTALRDHLNQELADGEGRKLFQRMVGENARIVQPLSIFNRLKPSSRDGEEVIDLKRTGLRLIVDAMRVFALQAGVSRCKTLERIAALRRLGVFDPDFCESMRIAFEELQDLLLSHQLEQIRRGEAPDPLLRMERLSSHDRERLRLSLRASRRMREHLQLTFGVVMR
ncbi:CBS domain-containing protein [Natronocella acetinitrilica]|uniref:CBS domain-containing protein n=1 Tax=Natronocella acetinitrilica TaxID=414046 RepID=A0AAE3KC24_9GAMM|nr:DUF294 nucleotidyltransferase-like domain-containing protein [Natronocella acetinitrilica]MCP1675261.1 CBS domain-containing protein [Natronocella acetinitrilica]